MGQIATTEIVNKILSDHYNGLPITRKNKIFYRGELNARKANILFAFTKDEMSEYVKCALDVVYFIEKYCKITMPNGINNVILRDYQKEWIENFKNNRFLIYLTSRQTGYTSIMPAVYLHYLIFNNEKNIAFFSNKGDTTSEFIKKLYNYYLLLPYFLKPGICHKNVKSIKFDNRSRIIAPSMKNLAIGYTIDIVSFMEFAYIPESILDKIYKSIFPMVSATSKSKFIIQSTPNGMNKFMDLVQNSERKEGDPSKNLYKTIRTYWWEVAGRDKKWKQNEINMLGSEELFNQEYDLKFTSKH